jgi:hypothetical protein
MRAAKARTDEYDHELLSAAKVSLRLILLALTVQGPDEAYDRNNWQSDTRNVEARHVTFPPLP